MKVAVTAPPDLRSAIFEYRSDIQKSIVKSTAVSAIVLLFARNAIRLAK